MKKKLLAVALMLLAGCATKQYPQAPAVTAEEAAAFDCRALDQEIASARSVQHEIDETGRFDVLTVMGFVGDFGLGNGIAKSRATGKAQARLHQLSQLKAAQCAGAVTPAGAG
ncbi:hypothetical protein J9874_01211 [Duffyella gerundensis]|uniref:hypothetical protein n=1 Tax=Duffyella gerundensis TaxID=1619313 RepID=UPI001CE2DEBF|nr:hypothetical protein [Duffyella gerundensis]UCB30682.1 hypothetical protein J9874_01211 [Duffyella gerundensis]